MNRRLRERRILKKNPLKNTRVMAKLNPYAGVQKKAARLLQEKRKAQKQHELDARRGVRGIRCLVVDTITTHFV
jgi:hypothetical protein